MQLGSFTIEILSEGRFEIFRDGHINRSDAAEETALKTEITSPKLSSEVGINPILIKTGSQNVLLDTGLGWGLDAKSNYNDVSNVQTNLEIFGLHPRDITHVILSHLHYDHAAGCSFTDDKIRTRPTFPNATYYVQQQEWEFALSRNEQKTTGVGYRLDDFYRLMADERVKLLTSDQATILDGISVMRTGGHTPGHQIVIISSNGERAYYLGDLLPSSTHLNHYGMRDLDADQLQAKKSKIQLLRSAFAQNASLLFYHALYSNIGRLERDKEKRYVLKKLD